MGYIAILTNEMFNDFVKIDYTNSIERLLKHIEEDRSVPIPYKVYATYMVPEISEYRLIEALNVITQGSHTNGDFYKIKPEVAYDKLEAIAMITGTLNNLSMWNHDDVEDSTETKPSTYVSFKETKKMVPDGIYHLTLYKEAEDRLIDVRASVKDGNWTLLKGSALALTTTDVLTKGTKDVFYSLPKDEDGILMEDYFLGDVTPSLAAGAVRGADTNGWTTWKTEDGQPIDIFRH